MNGPDLTTLLQRLGTDEAAPGDPATLVQLAKDAPTVRRRITRQMVVHGLLGLALEDASHRADFTAGVTAAILAQGAHHRTTDDTPARDRRAILRRILRSRTVQAVAAILAIGAGLVLVLMLGAPPPPVVKGPPAPTPSPASPAPVASAMPTPSRIPTTPSIAWDPCDQAPPALIGRNNGSGWASGWTDRKITWEADQPTAAADTGPGHLLFLPDLNPDNQAERRLLQPVAEGHVWIAIHAQVRFGPAPRAVYKTQWTAFHLLRDSGSPKFSFGFTRTGDLVTWHAFSRTANKNEEFRNDIPVFDTRKPGWLVLHLDLHPQGADMTMWADPPADREPERAAGRYQADIPFTPFDRVRFSGYAAELRLYDMRIGRTWDDVRPPH